uniref:Uncharacterized protein n=1 Tax=Sus scrofa TaxID=9823 RepID=A0A8D0MVD7_PIG
MSSHSMGFFVCLCFFLFWPPYGIWSSLARDQIQATVVIYATAKAMLDPLTHCAEQGIEPVSLVLQRYRPSCCVIVGTPLFFLMVSFAVQNLLSLIRSHLFIFVFIFINLGGGSKKIFLQFMAKSVLPIFSSKSFIICSLRFRSLIHFEFMLVYGIREFSHFHSFTCTVQFSQHHLLKKLSFLHCIFLLPL